MAGPSELKLIARRLTALVGSNALLRFAALLLALGALVFAIHLRNGRMSEAQCRVTAKEELGFLTVRLQHQLGGVTHLSAAIASCTRPDEKAHSCGQPVASTRPCFYSTVSPDEVFSAPQRPERFPLIPIALLLGGAALLAWALARRLTAPAADAAALDAEPTRFVTSSVGTGRVIIGTPLVLAGLAALGLALNLRWTSSSLHPGFADFALLAGAGAILLGSWLGFSRSEVRLHTSGLLEEAGGLFRPWPRRFHALACFARAHVTERRGTTHKGASFILHYLVLDPSESAGRPVELLFPDETSARGAAREIEARLPR